jgi:4'-phosphopantetheinyl transferase
LNTIYPVILSVPDPYKRLAAREKVLKLSEHARKALAESSQKSGFLIKHLCKDENGMPLPCNGTFWSITHKTDYVAGVCALNKTGIDIEKIKHCSKALFKKTAHDDEWALAQTEDSFKLFFRYWTAKESVIKADGNGIKDLLRCRITRIIDDTHLMVYFNNKDWHIEHVYFDGHIASVVKNSQTVQWIIK